MTLSMGLGRAAEWGLEHQPSSATKLGLNGKLGSHQQQPPKPARCNAPYRGECAVVTGPVRSGCRRGAVDIASMESHCTSSVSMSWFPAGASTTAPALIYAEAIRRGCVDAKRRWPFILEQLVKCGPGGRGAGAFGARYLSRTAEAGCCYSGGPLEAPAIYQGHTALVGCLGEILGNIGIFFPPSKNTGKYDFAACALAEFQVPGVPGSARAAGLLGGQAGLPCPPSGRTATPTPHGVLTLAFFPGQATPDRGVTPQSPRIESGRDLFPKHELELGRRNRLWRAAPGRNAEQSNFFGIRLSFRQPRSTSNMPLGHLAPRTSHLAPRTRRQPSSNSSA